MHVGLGGLRRPGRGGPKLRNLESEVPEVLRRVSHARRGRTSLSGECDQFLEFVLTRIQRSIYKNSKIRFREWQSDSSVDQTGQIRLGPNSPSRTPAKSEYDSSLSQ